MRDDAYGMIGGHQAEQRRERRAVDFGNPDLVLLAESFGGTGRRVGAAHSLPDLLVEAERTPGLCLIDCPTSYDAAEVLESGGQLDVARDALRRLG